jgi:sugar diacid utilization regulator
LLRTYPTATSAGPPPAAEPRALLIRPAPGGPTAARDRLKAGLDACVKAAQGTSGLLYVWDAAAERLVVRVASDDLEQHVDRLSLENGEGLTGWAALNRQPAIACDVVQGDARFKRLDGVDDRQWRSYLAVPILTADAELIGVVTIAGTDRTFCAADADAVAFLASVIGETLGDQAHRRELLRHRRALLAMRHIGEVAAADVGTDRLLNTVAQHVLEALDADVAALFLSPSARAVPPTAFALAAGCGIVERPSRMLAVGPIAALPAGEPGWFTSAEHPEVFGPFAMADGGELRSMLALTLAVRGRTLGYVVAYHAGAGPGAACDDDGLRAIASLSAMAIHQAQALGMGGEAGRSRALLNLLFDRDAPHPRGTEILASELGADLSQPHVAIVLKLDPVALDGQRGASLHALATAVRRTLDGTVVEPTSAGLRGIVRVASRTPAAVARALDDLLHADAVLAIAARGGVSDATTTPEDLAQSLVEAEETVAAARTLPPGRRVWAREELGEHWYVSRLASVVPFDGEQRRLLSLLERDRETGEQLFQTLEVYLDEGGNSARAARRLYVHRNTLRMRLERVAALLGVPLDDPGGTLALHLAVKLVRHRAGEPARTIATPAGGAAMAPGAGGLGQPSTAGA